MQSFLSIWYLSTTLRRSSLTLAYFRRLGTRHSGFGSTHRIVREAPDSGTAASIFVKKKPSEYRILLGYFRPLALEALGSSPLALALALASDPTAGSVHEAYRMLGLILTLKPTSQLWGPGPGPDAHCKQGCGGMVAYKFRRSL